MLPTDKLRALIRDRESDRVERTVSKSKTDKFGEAICAFANDFRNHGLPGYLLIGVDDHGRVSGIAVTDQMLRNLSTLASNVNLVPLPAITVQRYTLPEVDQADSGGLQEGVARHGTLPTVLDRRQFRMPRYAQALS